MSNIQKRLNSLKPHVIGIRFHEGIPLVDVILKEGWGIPKSEYIKFAEGDKGSGYFMFFSDDENYGIDEILNYVEQIININIEREKKNVLLKEKVVELQTFFKKHSLNDLYKMKFVLNNDISDDIMIDDEDLKLPSVNKTTINTNDNKLITNEINEDKTPPIIETKEQLKEVFDEKPRFRDDMTDEEREEEEAIAKARNYRKQQEELKKNGNVNKSNNLIKTQHKGIELPPKNIKTTCNCGDSLETFCDVCMESKGL